jgi:hypothetical protein
VNGDKTQASDKRAERVPDALGRCAPRQKLFLVPQDYVDVFFEMA